MNKGDLPINSVGVIPSCFLNSWEKYSGLFPHPTFQAVSRDNQEIPDFPGTMGAYLGQYQGNDQGI